MTRGRKSIGHVYSVMEELQRLRAQVLELTEKNRDLAKALVGSRSVGYASLECWLSTDVLGRMRAGWT